jgi:hypothetical protein
VSILSRLDDCRRKKEREGDRPPVLRSENQPDQAVVLIWPEPMAACAAASRAIGTR